jgi:hypothetical protein
MLQHIFLTAQTLPENKYEEISLECFFTAFQEAVTERRGRLNTPASYPGNPGLKSRSGDRLS